MGHGPFVSRSSPWARLKRSESPVLEWPSRVRKVDTLRDLYRFGPFRLDATRRQLWVADAPAKLGARAFDLLLILVERRDRMVSKSELLDTVWPGLVVEENNLQVHISALRKLLGPTAIATIPGRGYQFTAVLDDDREPATTAPAGDSGTRPVPHNLPLQRTHFIGREAALADCARLLHDVRLLTITGIGGCGKTRLALELAQQQRETFADGVWLVDLAPLQDAQRVAHALAFVVGVREEAGTPLIDRLSTLLAAQRMLIVLDNCEHVLDAVAELVDVLLARCAGLRIVATSRESLGVSGEQAFYLRPLSVPAGTDLDAVQYSEAGRLFIDRARQTLPEFEADARCTPAIADICRRLDGIALAIELAAARIKMLSVDEICARLDDRFQLLSGGARALPRHQTLHATLQWSHDSLTPPERRLFRHLAVFAGGCTLAAATCVAGATDECAVLEGLTQLHDKSLLEVDRDGAGPPRYRMLETVRQYAVERLAEAGEADAVRTRHLGYCVELAEASEPQILGPDQGAWLARLAREQENLIAAHGWCEHAPGGGEAGLRLVSALRHFWITSDQLERGLGLARAALARAGAEADPRSHCSTHLAIGQFSFFLGHYEEAVHHAQKALELARAADSAPLCCTALNHRAQAFFATGQPSCAIRDYEEACDIARRLGRHTTLGGALNGLAEVHRSLGRFTEAEAFYEEAVAVGRALRSPGSTAPPLGNLVRVLIATGKLARARSLLLECLTIVAAAGLKAMIEQLFEVGAGLAATQGDHLRAARFCGASLALLHAAGRHREPVDEAFIAPLLARSRAALGNDVFAAAQAAGRALSVEASTAELRQWLDRDPPAG